MPYTFEHKVNLLKKGKILTFTKEITDTYQYLPKKQSGHCQILIKSVVKKAKKNHFQLIGVRFDSPMFSSLEELVNSIDWNDYYERSQF